MFVPDVHSALTAAQTALKTHAGEYENLRAAHHDLCEVFSAWMRHNRERGVANDMVTFKELTLVKMRLANAVAMAEPKKR